MASTKLFNSRILVLGGTSGIGFAVASAALEQGAFVVISGSSSEKLEHALSRLRDAHPSDVHRRITGYTCDLSNPEKVEENVLALLQAATSIGAPEAEQQPRSTLLDHIVFTAGNSPTSMPTLQNATAKQMQSAGNNIRILGGFMIAKHAPQYMHPTSSSSITFTSGTASAKPPKGWAIATSMLGAVEGMTRGLAVDLAPIRVNGVVPGAVKTEMFTNAFPQQEMLDAVFNHYATGTLVGHVAQPEDVAEAYIYLMKDRFCTGSLIHTNGGIFLK